MLRKFQELGLRPDYDTDDEIRGFVRCLSALSHVPPNNVLTAFQTLVETMPANEKVNDIVTYFENTTSEEDEDLDEVNITEQPCFLSSSGTSSIQQVKAWQGQLTV